MSLDQFRDLEEHPSPSSDGPPQYSALSASSRDPPVRASNFLLDMATSALHDIAKTSTAVAGNTLLGNMGESRPLKWAIFTPPKSFARAPHQHVALRSWLNLRVPPRVYLVEAKDLDKTEIANIRAQYNIESFPGSVNADGFLLQNALFQRASMEQDMDVVVVINSDIILGDDFVDALEHAMANFDRFLMVGARYDNLVVQDMPLDADSEWIRAFRERTWEEGALHSYGGTDYYAWRPVGDPALAVIGGRIPPFTYGRGKADNWVIDMAVKYGVVEVVDATTAVFAVHPAHTYEPLSPTEPASSGIDGSEVEEVEEKLEAEGKASDGEMQRDLEDSRTDYGEGKRHTLSLKRPEKRTRKGHRSLANSEDLSTTANATKVGTMPVKYVNHWSSTSAGDPQADMNKHLAYQFGDFQNGDGTPLHAVWELMLCVEAEAGRGVGGERGYIEKPCIRYRTRPGACPCAHSPMVPRTLTDVETHGRVRVCGKVPLGLREVFDEDFAFQQLMSQQAKDKTVVLIGFNYGYQDMLLNMVCRLQQLAVPNYVIAAFDAEAMAFCRQQVLPCFPVNAEIAADADMVLKNHGGGEDAKAAGESRTVKTPGTQSPSKPVDLQAAAHAFGTKGFRALTKLKSQQVLRILEQGYDVLWSDVDIFWKINPIPGVLEEMKEGGGVDIAIQSNAPPEEASENGYRRINSGFYMAKSNSPTVEAFRQIVEHARSSTLSEQPSFYTVLCGDEMQFVSGSSYCLNTEIPVKTRLLSREIYPNGAMVEVVKGVTPATEDDVAIVHFNWLEGHDAKVESFVNASMWLLHDDDMTCKYDMIRGSEGLQLVDTIPLPPSYSPLPNPDATRRLRWRS